MQKTQSPLLRLWQLGREHHGGLIAAIFCAVAGVLLGLLPYLSAGHILVALLTGQRDWNFYLLWCMVALGGYLAKTLLYNLALSLSHKATFQILRDIRKMVLSKMPRLPLGDILDTSSGRLKQIVVDQVESMLKAEHITKQYQIPGGRHTVFDAVSDVSIELGNGGVTAIVGESGSGKSTLARVLSYVERPDGGRVFLDGLEVSACGRKEFHTVRGKVQLVMQNALGSLDPHQSVASILEEPLRLLFHMGTEERKQRCLELLDMARLERDTLRRRPDELSGGQQKRLCIARALAAQPQHIIFDESFSGLDVTLKKQVLDFLKELQTELQISFLVITHDLDTAMYMAGTIHVMRRGKIIETLEHPRSFSDFQEPYTPGRKWWD